MGRTIIARAGILMVAIAFSLTACETHTPQPPTFHEADSSTVAKAAAAGAFSGAVVGSLLSTEVPGAPLTAAGAGVGAVAGATLGRAMSHKSLTPEQIITDSGAQIINIGEDTMIVLPTDLFFYRDSTHVNEGYYIVLNAVVDYINQSDVESIKVSGYTDKTGDPRHELALSRQQAQNIAKYMQGMGVKAPFMYSIGYGEQFPIAFSDQDLPEPTNNRIQITYRRLYYGS